MILGAKQPAALQLGDNETDEVVKCARKIGGKYHESVRKPGAEPLLQRICNPLRRAVDHPVPARCSIWRDARR